MRWAGTRPATPPRWPRRRWKRPSGWLTPRCPPARWSCAAARIEATGAHAAALADLTQGADGARAAGDRRLEMLALRELGGDVPVSRGLPISYYVANLESGLRIAESLGDRASEAQHALPARRHRGQPAAPRRGARLTACGRVAAGRAAADDQALAAGLDGLKIAYLSLGDTRALADVLAELEPAAAPPG